MAKTRTAAQATWSSLSHGVLFDHALGREGLKEASCLRAFFHRPLSLPERFLCKACSCEERLSYFQIASLLVRVLVAPGFPLLRASD